jgi:hypothetical protein
MNLIPYVAIWAIGALALGLLALYRRTLIFHGDDAVIPQGKLERVDRVGKGLAVFIAVLGFVILVQGLDQAWRASGV